MVKNLEVIICEHKLAAESQKKNEITRYGKPMSCQGYTDKGCFDCNGYNTNCPLYLNFYDEMKEMMKKGSDSP